MKVTWTVALATAIVWTGLSAPFVRAQTMGDGLKQAFETAWSRQPEAQALPSRQDAARARRDAASALTPEPPSLDLSARTDRFNQNQGTREYDVGLALPLWLPGERPRAQALADAEIAALDGRGKALLLAIAGDVRAAWWNWQRSLTDREVAQARLANARVLAADVTRRVKAGDLARSDQHQADGAAAAAAALAAEAETQTVQAAQLLRALTGIAPTFGASSLRAELEPPASVGVNDSPLLRELAGRAQFARSARELASVQTRANPELAVFTRRERNTFADPYDNSWGLGVRFPFGSSAKNRARVADAGAAELEAEAELRFQQERLAGEADAARARLAAGRLQLEAAERRAELARETRAFFEKSFRLGESDLPTRLRIELEAFEAERQAARARIDLAQSISLLRQALGLLPE